MKVLVLGATGMAGHVITLYLKEQGNEVYSIARKPSAICDGIVCDVFKIDILRDYIEKQEFDVIVNCVGLLNTACDNNISQAIFLNSYLPHFLADIVCTTQTKIIHLSTDCVFSGKCGNYNEGDITDGISYYDRSKALGEINDFHNLTFRNSIIGPDMNKNGIGLFNWFMEQHSHAYGYTNVIWNGVTSLVLAQAIEEAVKENLCGIYHLINSNAISKYDLLKIFNKCFKNDTVEINKNDSIYLNKSLVNNRSDFMFQIPDYEIMIFEMKSWIQSHDYLYPHYKIKGMK